MFWSDTATMKTSRTAGMPRAIDPRSRLTNSRRKATTIVVTAATAVLKEASQPMAIATVPATPVSR